MAHRRSERRANEPTIAEVKSHAHPVQTSLSTPAPSPVHRAPRVRIPKQPKPSGAPIAPSNVPGSAAIRIERPADTLKREQAGDGNKPKKKKAKQKEEEGRRNLAEEHQAVKAAAAKLDAAVKNEPLAGNDKTSSTNPLRNPGQPGTGNLASRRRSHDAKAPSSRGDRGVPADSPFVIERKVRLLLNKLAPASFDSTSHQLVEIANTSEREKDGRTLIHVIRLIFEAATNDATRSQIYARLCRTMMEKISPGVMDDSIRNAEGQPIVGGHLFRKYLLNRCQEDFERGWTSHVQVAVPVAANTVNNDQKSHSERRYDEKAKRQGLGLVRFIGELFKVQMLTERIMHGCINKFVSKLDAPGEEEIESLCLLLTTVGQRLDTKNARAHMDIYFLRLKDISVLESINARLRSMIVEVIDLRSRNWDRRDSPSTPTTTQQQATAEEVRPGSGAAGRLVLANDLQVNDEQWSTSKVIDIFHFGDTSVTVKLAASSVVPGKKLEDTRETSPAPRVTTSGPVIDKPSANSSIRAPHLASESAGSGSADRGKGGRRQRQKQTLGKPSEDVQAGEMQQASKSSGNDVSIGKRAAHKKVMTDVDIIKQVAEGIEKLFSTRELDGAVACFGSLPPSQRYKMVESVFSRALGSTDAEATLAGELFAKVMDAGKLTSKDVEKGVAVPMKSLDDIAVDTPAAYALAARMLFLPKLDKKATARLGESIARSVVTPRDRLLKQLEKLAS